MNEKLKNQGEKTMKSRMTFIVIFVIVAMLLATGCAMFSNYGKLEKSARQYYQRGNYDQAVFECTASLRIKPDYAKAQALIQDAFKSAVNTHASKISELKKSSAKFKWDDIVYEYQALIKLNQAITDLPPLVDKKTKSIIKLDFRDYSSVLDEAKNNASEAHYQEGLFLSKKKGLDFQKQAAKEFKISENFIPGYKDSSTLYENCRQAGIKRIAIIPFEDKTGKKGEYGALSETIVDDIVSDIMNDPTAMEFLEIVSRDQLEQVMQEQRLGFTGIIDDKTAVDLGKLLGVHEIVTGKITQIVYTPERTTEKSIKEKGRAVIGKEKYYDKDGKLKEKDKWGDVYANVKIYTRSSNASISGSYTIIDIKTAKLKKKESFRKGYDFNHEWATFSGNQEALSSESEILASKTEQFAPVEDEMVSQAAKNLSNSLARTLKEYAR